MSNKVMYFHGEIREIRKYFPYPELLLAPYKVVNLEILKYGKYIDIFC